MVDKKLNEAGETSFGGPLNQGGSTYSPIGNLGKWFSKFFANKSKPYIALQGQDQLPYTKDPLAGDTYQSLDLIKVKQSTDPALPSSQQTNIQVFIPEYERSRKDRYRQFESMDTYPEISSAWDIYADDSTQKDLRGKQWLIDTDSPVVKKEVEELFFTLELDRYYWDIIRNMTKYGDCFTELVLDENNPKLGVQRLKILNPSYIYRVENIYGYLTSFLQEIPKQSDFSAFGTQSDAMRNSQYITLDKNQIVHFRLHTSDPRYYPYGRSVAAGVTNTFKSLKMMEDAMLVYRLSRAPEKRVFYINVGNMPAAKTPAFLEKMKLKLKKEKFFNSSTGTIDERYNPLNVDEDLYIPHRGDKETRVEVLPGAQNLGDIDDVKYFLDKVLAGMKVPRDYVVESNDKSQQRKANLSQLDAKFARTILRVQKHFLFGLQSVVRLHLKIRGFPTHLINRVKIRLPDPSDIFTKRKLEIDEAKVRVVAALKGLQLIPNEIIYKEYFEMDDIEIEEYKNKLQEEMVEQQQQMQAMAPAGMAPGMDPGMGGPPNANPGAPDPNVPEVGGRSGVVAQDQPGAAKATPPMESINYLNTKLLNESNVDKLKIMNRIVKKLKN